jgi:hypothetical protein
MGDIDERGEVKRVRAIQGLDELRARGGLSWCARERGWSATPEDVVAALVQSGFAEFKREVTSHVDGAASGGLWQGLDVTTGGVASVMWLGHHASDARVVFVDVEGEPVEEGNARDGWWNELDEAVMGCLASGDAMEPAEISRRIGLSEAAVVSLLTLLITEGRVRICRVAATAAPSMTGRPVALVV